MMLHTIGRLLGLLILLGGPFSAIAASPDDAGIKSAITQQLEAIKRGDGSAAFAIASPTIQAQFQDAQTFMRMVQLGFPHMLAARNHRFLNLDSSNGSLIQRVLIESEGATVVARYEMVEINGVWRINGCVLEAAEDV